MLACAPIETTPPSAPATDSSIIQDTSSPKLELTSCDDSPDIQCGQLEVWENRSTNSGRKISVFVKVLRATGPNPAPDPLFFFSGGPGESASSIPPQAFELERKQRDIVFVDQRGTGKSHSLACKSWVKSSPQNMLTPYLQLPDVIQCRDQLSKNADLTQYTTAHYVDDVDEIRAALGYDIINIQGGSYGTRPVQVYLRRHPKRVRAAVLHGVLSLEDKYPLQAPFAAQQALDSLFAACQADQRCKNTWGDPSKHLETILARFAKGPLTVPWKGEQLSLEREVMMEGLRHLMYHASGSSLLPKLLHHAAVQNDFSGILQSIFQFESQLQDGPVWSSGLWLSVSCSEDAPWIQAEDLQRAGETTVFGSYRPRVHVEACKLWPKAKLNPEFRERVHSSTPALILSGKFDPATSAAGGSSVAEGLPNSRHIVVQEGHGHTDWACTSRVISAFLESGTSDNLDTRCLQSIKLPPWPAKPISLPPKALKKIAGVYVPRSPNEVPPALHKIRIVFRDKALFLEGTGGPALRLNPVTPIQFTAEELGLTLEVRMKSDQNVESLTLKQSGLVIEFRPRIPYN